MVEKEIEIHNKAGIHCRPSSVIISAVQDYPGNTFLLTASGKESHLESILDLLGMELQCHGKAKLQVSGPEEAEASEKIAALFEKEYDFR